MLFTSLILIAIGNGNIRACITSLGGHQFKLPEQAEALNTYFSHYYFIYYSGILLSKIVPPAIRADTQCFGKDECYAAVFGFLASIFLCCWSKFLICLFDAIGPLVKSLSSNIRHRNVLLQKRRSGKRSTEYLSSNSLHMVRPGPKTEKQICNESK